MDKQVLVGEKEYVNSLLEKEFVSKIFLSSFSFIFTTIILLFIDLKKEGILDEVLLCIDLMINFGRLFLSYKATKNVNLSQSTLKLMKRLSYSNAIVWGMFFIYTAEEVFHDPKSLIIMLVVSLCFGFGSVITLSSDKKLAYTFQTFVTVPYIFECFYSFLSHGIIIDFYLGILILILYASGIALSRSNNKLLSNLYSQEFKLKKFLDQLSDSQKKLVDQTQMLVHSSRLASLGEMSGGVAHEINNPLAIISGYSERLLEQLEDSLTVDSEMVKSNINKIISASERISKIVKGLKQFSRESERDPMTSVNFDEIMKDSLSLCSEKILQNGVNIRIEGKSDFNINCRSVQISQIMINLISNAYQEIESNKMGEEILIEITESSTHHLISVLNAGKEIPQEIKDRLFQPFFTTKEVGKGTGLGLSISLGLAQTHGGNLKIKDNDRNLIEFQLSLPKV